MREFVSRFSLVLLDAHTIEDGKGNLTSDLAFYDIGIAEIVLMPSSRLLKQTVGDSGFREKFNVNVLGIRRKNDYILHDLKDVKMLSGDVLLVQGTWKDIAPVEFGRFRLGGTRPAVERSRESYSRL